MFHAFVLSRGYVILRKYKIPPLDMSNDGILL